MTSVRTLAVGIALFAAALRGLGAQQPTATNVAADSACRVTGRVSGAGMALPGVSITLKQGDAVQAVTSTGVDGSYRLTAPPGTYEVGAELTGFGRLAREVSLEPSACEPTIDLTMTLAPREIPQTGAGGAPDQQAQSQPEGDQGSGRRGGLGRGGRGAGGAAGPALPRFQTLAVRPEESAAAAQPSDIDADTGPPLLPPGFGSEASADAIAVNGNTARVDRGQLNDRLDALARGDFPIGNIDVPAVLAAIGAGPGGQAPFPIGGFQGEGGGPGGRGGFFIGGRGGAQQRIVTTADYTFGGSMLDAAPYRLRSDAPTTETPYMRQSFGTTLGGPLKIPHVYNGTTRTNFTFGYNGSRGSSLFDQYATVPSAAMRAGDFSSLSTPLLNPATGLPFPGNQIPQSDISSQTLDLMRFIPLPNLDGTTRNYHHSITTASTNDAVNLRLTHNFTPNTAGPAGRFGGRGGGGAGGAGGPGRGGGRGQQLRRGTNVIMTAQLQYRRNDGDQANVFSTLGGQVASTNLGVPVSLNIARGRNLHALNLNFSRSSSATMNRFAGVENVAGNAGILGVGSDPFGWGVPTLSFSSITSLRDVTPSERGDRRISAGYTWSHPVSRHMFRVGGDMRLDRSSSHTEANAAGSFVFTGLYTTGDTGRATGADFADFLLGHPAQASLQSGPGDVAFTARSTSLFVQDDWRVSSSLTLNLGLRYELLWPFTESSGHVVNLDVTPDFSAAVPVLAGGTAPFTGEFPASLLVTDTNNLAPRVGAAWRHNGIVVRGGYGVSYNSGSYAAIARNLASQPPFAVTNTNIGALDRVLMLEDALAAPPPSETTNNYGAEKDYALGRVQTWNVDIARNFRQVWNAGAGYTRTMGASLDIIRAPNRGPDGLRIEGVQPFIWQTSEGSSVLNSATFRLQRRQVRGLGGGVTYTLAKSRDNAPSIGGGGGGSSGVVAQDDQDLNAEWGLSNFDRRHRLQANLQVDLPFGPNRRWLNNGGRWAMALENWRVTTSFLGEAGTPLTPRVQGASRDVSQGINGALRANYTGAPVQLADPTIDRFFDTAAFSVPTAGFFGTSPRNIIIGPGTRQLDAQVSRDVTFGGTRAVTIQIRASNLLNLANYAAIDTYVNSPTFGQVFSVRPMRSVQLNLRFRF